MTQAPELRATRRQRREPLGHLRAVAFLPSGRDDYIASARMTFEEYLALDYEGGLAEWVDGEVRLYVSATVLHQQIVEFLHLLLGFFCEATGVGVTKLAPYAMEAVLGGAGREPDLTFIAAARALGVLSRSHLTGRPDLVVEVVSNDSTRRDNEEKFREYQAAGIPEYWIIDPRPGSQTARFYTLAGGVYQPLAEEDGIVRSTIVPGFWLRTEWLFEDPPRALPAIREILGDRAPRARLARQRAAACGGGPGVTNVKT